MCASAIERAKVIAPSAMCLSLLPLAAGESPTQASAAQGVGGTLIGENGLVVMTGSESVEWYNMYQSHGLMLFHLLCSGHYYEPFSPQQPPVLCSSINIQ